MSYSILYIDDLELNRKLVDMLLSNTGFSMFTAKNCDEGLDMIRVHNPDLILLDIMMPKIDGWETFQYIRQISAVPVIFFSSMDRNRMIEGFEKVLQTSSKRGMIDFVQRGDTRELVVRIRKLLLESKLQTAANGDALAYNDGYLAIDLLRREVTKDEERVILPRIPYIILRELLSAHPDVAESEQLLRSVWGEEVVSHAEQTVKLRLGVLRLRKLIEPDHKDPTYVTTVPGGYRFEKRDEDGTTVNGTTG